jgi:hypothetical protein
MISNTIKINLTDGNEIITRINGTPDDIFRHYQNNNVDTFSSGHPQVKRIEFVESPLLEKHSSYVYLFIDWNGNGLLQ